MTAPIYITLSLGSQDKSFTLNHLSKKDETWWVRIQILYLSWKFSLVNPGINGTDKIRLLRRDSELQKEEETF